MIGGLNTKLKLIDLTLLFALIACLCLLMSMTSICAADSDDILDNQSASIESIPLDDNQEVLCGLGSVSNGLNTSYYFDESNDTSNLNSAKADDAFNLDIDKTPEKINATLNQSSVNNNAKNPANSSIFAVSSPQLINQTFSDCEHEHYNCNLKNTNFDSGKRTAENRINDNITGYYYDFNTINQINISNYQINNLQYPIYITRDWDGSEKLYKKYLDSNILTLNFNQVFKEIILDDNYAPNYQLSDDSIQENDLGFSELIIEDNDCLPSNYQFLDQLIQIDYGNQISAIHILDNSLTGYNSTCAGLEYETLLSPIILSFNFKGAFTFNYMDSKYPNVNIININKNGVKISGVYAEGNKLTIVNNSLGKCIYTTPKFINKESKIVVENTVKSLIFINALTFNNNIHDCQSNWNATKTITPTNIYIFNNNYTKNIESVFKKNVFNIKNFIFNGSHIGPTLLNANCFSVSNCVNERINDAVETIEIHSIFNQVKFCNNVVAVGLEHINCNDYSFMSNGGK